LCTEVTLKENLHKRTKKNKDKIISLLAKSLLIRHKPTKLEYTISKVVISDGKPSIVAYRYYSKPGAAKKVFVEIPLDEFKNYETV
tara:strand:+ start:230 stop:487 length:258 start_codon:yes stop_codon:yes gene_type:complete